jgi:Uma2 family endonuclease
MSVLASAPMGTPALKSEFITEEEYLAGEELTEVAHEYIEGRVYAMSVPTDTHGEIAGTVFRRLGDHLQGKKCRPWMGNMRLRIAFLNRTVHYIPDVLVACDDPPRDRRFREQPLAIFEVLSKSTEATDQREKLLAYTTLPSLRHYFIVRQDRMEIAHIRRTDSGWEELTYTKPEQEIEVPEIDFRISLSEVFAAAALQG